MRFISHFRSAAIWSFPETGVTGHDYGRPLLVSLLRRNAARCQCGTVVVLYMSNRAATFCRRRFLAIASGAAAWRRAGKNHSASHP